MILLLIFGCIDPPKPLTNSRIPQVAHGKMIQYGNLRGFLVSKGSAKKTLLWYVPKINPQNKICAQQQLPNDHRVLVVEASTNPTEAQKYLSQPIPPQDFKCQD